MVHYLVHLSRTLVHFPILCFSFEQMRKQHLYYNSDQYNRPDRARERLTLSTSRITVVCFKSGVCVIMYFIILLPPCGNL